MCFLSLILGNNLPSLNSILFCYMSIFFISFVALTKLLLGSINFLKLLSNWEFYSFEFGSIRTNWERKYLWSSDFFSNFSAFSFFYLCYWTKYQIIKIMLIKATKNSPIKFTINNNFVVGLYAFSFSTYEVHLQMYYMYTLKSRKLIIMIMLKADLIFSLVYL